MKTNNANGRTLAVAVGAYMVIKMIVNMILGGGSVGNLIYTIIEALALATGLMYINYVIAGILVLVMLLNLKNNITNFSSNWFYLLEGIIDIGAAVLLVFNKDVKEHFTNKWSEIGSLFSK